MGYIGFGLTLRALRGARGWTQDDLAKRSKVTRASIGSYEQGRRAPSLVSAVALADALGVTLDQLAGRAPIEI